MRFTTTGGRARITGSHLFIRCEGLERPLLSGAPLHRHRHLQKLYEFLLAGSLLSGLPNIGVDAGFAANRDRNDHGGEQFVLRRHLAIAVRLLSHAQQGTGHTGAETSKLRKGSEPGWSVKAVRLYRVSRGIPPFCSTRMSRYCIAFFRLLSSAASLSDRSHVPGCSATHCLPTSALLHLETMVHFSEREAQ